MTTSERVTSSGLPRRAYKVSEVAEMWGVSPDTVYTLINKGELRHVKVSSLKLIPVDEVAAYEQRMAG